MTALKQRHAVGNQGKTRTMQVMYKVRFVSHSEQASEFWDGSMSRIPFSTVVTIKMNIASGNIPCTLHTSCHQTLQYYNSYNRTETIDSETQSNVLMVGVKTPETYWGTINYQ